ncbi:n-alpha-acetyltransferase catalytic subunit [Nannochloropsis gaditana]|uniref:N-alpha-acetyltransferase catalytic subunit n=1 Tax=Nannochloropsis gaditana TaxID=72520 RepID=W7U4Z6_9STRA|nr:n-alpha-acetyltransferase catalytic subunit [Nannochloropsis gaditana]
MSMKGKGGKGGKAKGGGKSCSGGGTIDIKRSKDRVTASINESLLTLRQALFNDLGQNKDVSVGIAAPFFKYDRKGVDANIEFKTKLNKEEVTWAFDNIKDSMEEIYDASGYGWDDEDKLAQLTEPEARFLVIRESRPEGTVTSPRFALKERNVYDQDEDGKKGEKQASGGDMKQTTRMKMARKKGQILGVVHFRFSVQGDFTDKMAGAPSLILWVSKKLEKNPKWKRDRKRRRRWEGRSEKDEGKPVFLSCISFYGR